MVNFKLTNLQTYQTRNGLIESFKSQLMYSRVNKSPLNQAYLFSNLIYEDNVLYFFVLSNQGIQYHHHCRMAKTEKPPTIYYSSVRLQGSGLLPNSCTLAGDALGRDSTFTTHLDSHANVNRWQPQGVWGGGT